jgi:hypothetical protein
MGARSPEEFGSFIQKRSSRRFSFCGHNDTGVVRDIDVESGVHLLIRVIRRHAFTTVTL